MNKKELKFGEDARLSIKRGIDKINNAIKISYGPMGRTAVIDKQYGNPLLTKDGISIIKDILLEDKFENLGCKIIKEVSQKTNDEVGDSSTGSVILSHAIITEGLKLVTSGINPIEIRKSLEKKTKEIVDNLKSMSTSISTKEESSQVASISANDKEIGDIIAEAIEEVGRDGVITIEDGQSFGISKEITKGTKIDKGYISPYFVSDQQTMKAELVSPYILVTDKKISNLQELLPILEKVIQSNNRSLLIIAEDVDGEPLATLVVNKMKGNFQNICIKAEGFGNNKKEILKDICILTGAKLISDEVGLKLENVSVEDLGRADKVISSKDDTIIIGGKGNEKEVEERIQSVKNEMEIMEGSFDKENLKKRLAKLSGGVCVIKVGAPTETEMKEKKDRIEDSVNATRAALEEGVVPGGGMALLLASGVLKEEKVDVDDYGTKILNKALLEPIKIIAENSGKDGSLILYEVINRNKDSEKVIGYNAAKDIFESMIDAGVIDPVKVVRTSLEHAVSAAIMFLSMEVAIVDKEDKKEDE